MEFLFILLVIIGAWVAMSRIYEKDKQDRRNRETACRQIIRFYRGTQAATLPDAATDEEVGALLENTNNDPAQLARFLVARSEKNSEGGTILGHERYSADENWYHIPYPEQTPQRPALNTIELPVAIPKHLRTRHCYIIGKTGSGKTTLLQNLIEQDLEAEERIGFAVIAPEPEMLTEQILPLIPDERVDDVIYFNPEDSERPVSFNPLHVDEGEDFDLRVDETLTIFKRILGTDAGARMAELLQQTLHALSEREGTTLIDVYRLLDRDDSSFRDDIIATSRDPETVAFFRDRYPLFAKDSHLPVVNRVSHLIRPRRIKRILCQPKGSLNFREAMDSGKILLFNLSDGLLGDATASILGQLIVAKLQSAALSRANIPSSQRRPFYVYIDEFQAFTGVAARSYEILLSRARKYGLGLILAHQQTGQIPHDLLREILGNVGTIITLQVSNADATKLSKEFHFPELGELKAPSPIVLEELRQGQALAKIGNHSVRITTEFPARADVSRTRAIIERARENYGTSFEESTLYPLTTQNHDDTDDDFTAAYDDEAES